MFADGAIDEVTTGICCSLRHIACCDAISERCFPAEVTKPNTPAANNLFGKLNKHSLSSLRWAYMARAGFRTCSRKATTAGARSDLRKTTARLDCSLISANGR